MHPRLRLVLASGLLLFVAAGALLVSKIGFFSLADYIAGRNSRLSSAYPTKQVFIVSDADWKKVLELVPVTTWTENGQVHANPTFVYHQEATGVDVDSLISFIQQYQPGKITIISPNDLAAAFKIVRALQSALPGNPALQPQNLTVNFAQTNYLSNYFSTVNDIVYSEANYSTALEASVYASLINSPLIIAGGAFDSGNRYKHVTCVGTVQTRFRPPCDERYTPAELQKKYAALTGTNKVLVTNAADQAIFRSQAFTPLFGNPTPPPFTTTARYNKTPDTFFKCVVDPKNPSLLQYSNVPCGSSYLFSSLTAQRRASEGGPDQLTTMTVVPFEIDKLKSYGQRYYSHGRIVADHTISGMTTVSSGEEVDFTYQLSPTVKTLEINVAGHQIGVLRASTNGGATSCTTPTFQTSFGTVDKGFCGSDKPTNPTASPQNISYIFTATDQAGNQESTVMNVQVNPAPGVKPGISQLFQGMSLAAPYLASAKQELLLPYVPAAGSPLILPDNASVDQTTARVNAVHDFVASGLKNAGIRKGYLTIVGSPDGIENRYLDNILADTSRYSSFGPEHLLDFATGRLYAISLTDLSGYIARDIAQKDLPAGKGALVTAMQNPAEIAEAMAFKNTLYPQGGSVDAAINLAGVASTTADQTGKPAIIQDFFNNTQTSATPLPGTLIIGGGFQACTFFTLAPGGIATPSSPCLQALRNGALGYIGFQNTTPNVYPINNGYLISALSNSVPVGEALRGDLSSWLSQQGDAIINPLYASAGLLGDPTVVVPAPSTPFPQAQLTQKSATEYAVSVPLTRLTNRFTTTYPVKKDYTVDGYYASGYSQDGNLFLTSDTLDQPNNTGMNVHNQMSALVKIGPVSKAVTAVDVVDESFMNADIYTRQAIDDKTDYLWVKVSGGLNSSQFAYQGVAPSTDSFKSHTFTLKTYTQSQIIPYQPGDLNGDGVVNQKDLNLLQDIFLGKVQPTALQKKAGDLAPKNADGSFGDGNLNAADINALSRELSGAAVDWPNK